MCEGARAPSGRRRQCRRCPSCVFDRLLCPETLISPWFTASCCRDGSYVAVFVRTLRVTCMRAVTIAGIEAERYCPIACATSPMFVSRDRSLRNWSVCQDWGPRWVGLDGPALALTAQQACPSSWLGIRKSEFRSLDR